ncbi:MAG TPA: hypothetical protein VHC70_06060 [Phycisphaerales bacterium]|nr:hypothetical protein [Phycisphaerales bacterium]
MLAQPQEPDMTYSELIQMYFERSNALQWYWTLYVVVIGGLLAFASIRKQPDRITTALVTVLYCFFAYKNLDAIHDVTLQRFAILDLIKQIPTSGAANIAAKAIDPTLNPPTFESVRTFHIASDALTVLALWAMELRRRRASSGGGAAS